MFTHSESVFKSSDIASYLGTAAMENNPLLWNVWNNLHSGLSLSAERFQERSSPQKELVRSTLGSTQHTAIQVPFVALSLLLYEVAMIGIFGIFITVSYLPSLPALQMNTDLNIKKINITVTGFYKLPVLFFFSITHTIYIVIYILHS